MGMFDNFIKQIDNGLKAVENGALEKRLEDMADAIDRHTKQAESTIQKVADKPHEALQKAERTKAELEKQAGTLKQQIGKNMDIITRKD